MTFSLIDGVGREIAAQLKNGIPFFQPTDSGVDFGDVHGLLVNYFLGGCYVSLRDPSGLRIFFIGHPSSDAEVSVGNDKYGPISLGSHPVVSALLKTIAKVVAKIEPKEGVVLRVDFDWDAALARHQKVI